MTYELTDRARHLARVGTAAARWEWRRGEPEGPVPARNVAAVVHLFAPVARVPDELAGICSVHVGEDSDGPDVYLAAGQGRLATVVPLRGRPPQAACHGTPQGWIDALLLSRRGGITATGHRALVAAMLASLSTAILA